MARDLTGKVIIITGASSGIGAATAVECAKVGMNVVLNARRADRLDAVADLVRDAGREVETVVGDVTADNMSENILQAAESRFGGFDVVFANAGYGFQKRAHEMAEDQLRRIFEVNFFAATDLLSLAARHLLARDKKGHLLMCSSCVAKFTLPGYSAYSATKAAQNHICRAMRIELEPHDIHVSSVLPITTETEFFEVAQKHSGHEAAGTTPHHAPRLFVQPPERVAKAVIKCLRKPHAEVWTSHTTRAVAAAMTMFPGFMDFVMRRAAAADADKGG